MNTRRTGLLCVAALLQLALPLAASTALAQHPGYGPQPYGYGPPPGGVYPAAYSPESGGMMMPQQGPPGLYDPNVMAAGFRGPHAGHGHHGGMLAAPVYSDCDECEGGGRPPVCREIFDSCQRVWARGEFLYYWTEGYNVPALVTASPATTPFGVAGVLPGATTLFGNGKIEDDERKGGKATIGFWMSGGDALGFEAHYMTFETESTDFFTSSQFTDGGTGPILARPFFDVAGGFESASLIAFPVGVGADGFVSVDTTSDVQSAGGLFRGVIEVGGTGCNMWRLDWLGGYRYFKLDDNMLITDFTSFGGTRISAVDAFDARNEFHGGEIGLSYESTAGRWSLDFTAKVALGNVNQSVNIRGNTTTTVIGGAPVTTPGGLLAQPSNSGRFARDEFTVLPEAELRVGFQIVRSARVYAGYNFVYIDSVMRPGGAIQQGPTGTPVGPGAVPPVFQFNDESFWMQGLTGGVEIRF